MDICREVVVYEKKGMRGVLIILTEGQVVVLYCCIVLQALSSEQLLPKVRERSCQAGSCIST